MSNNWKREHDELLFHAWHTAYLTAYAPQKSSKFVKLEKLIGATSRKRMTPEEIEAVTRSWLAGRKRRGA